MIKELPPIVMEPFNDAELTLLDEKLGSLSLLDLKSYIDSAKSSLQNQALASTWRPRIEVGMQHAQAAMARAEEAALSAAREAAEAKPEVAAPAAAKKKAAAKATAKAE